MGIWGQTEELDEEQYMAAPNKNLLFTLMMWIAAQHRVQFKVQEKQASWVIRPYSWNRRNILHFTNWNSSSVIGSLLVQVFASSEQVITPIPCRTSQENLAQSSVHPSTTACRHITHPALNLRGCQQCRHSSETEDVLWKQLEALLRPVLVNPPLPCQFSSARICLHKLLQPSPKSSSGEGEILTP